MKTGSSAGKLYYYAAYYVFVASADYYNNYYVYTFKNECGRDQ